MAFSLRLILLLVAVVLFAIAGVLVAVIATAAVPVYWGRGLSGLGLALVPATVCR